MREQHGVVRISAIFCALFGVSCIAGCLVNGRNLVPVSCLRIHSWDQRVEVDQNSSNATECLDVELYS